MKRFMAKLGNMKKEADWIVYPSSEDATTLTIQSDHRICQFDKKTGKGMLSKHKTYSQFADLVGFLGATPIVVPPEIIALAVGSQPHSGDSIGGGVVIIA